MAPPANAKDRERGISVYATPMGEIFGGFSNVENVAGHRRRPHPRHWQVLAELVGVSQDL
jgi:hypothetical protein